MGRGKKRRKSRGAYAVRAAAPSIATEAVSAAKGDCATPVSYEYGAKPSSPAVVGIWESFAARYLDDPQRVRIILSGDFARSLTDHSRKASHPAKDAAGVTLKDEQGGYIILVSSARHYAGSVPLTGKRRQIVVAHESLHVATKQRGEEMTSFTGQDSAECSQWYVNLAGGMIDEYRVELTLAEDGLTPIGEHRSRLAQICRAVAADLTSPPENESDSQMFKRLLRAFRASSYYLAQAAACAKGHGRLEEDGELKKDGEALLSSSSGIFTHSEASILEMLSQISGAGEPVPREILEATTEELSEELKRWMARLGFLWEKDGIAVPTAGPS